jgi:hypothetical protein
MTIDKNNRNDLFIDYDRQINRMILFMIKNILKYCSQKGLPGGHHFYITFKTTSTDFLILDSEEKPDIELLAKYPKEMMIVLQNSFSNLVVEDKTFSVILNFNSEPRKLIIPLTSILTFFDPFANFSVKLDPEKNEGLALNEILDFFDYDLYEFYDEEYDFEENDEISELFKYDYEKYKIEKNQKIVYFDELRKRISSESSGSSK